MNFNQEYIKQLAEGKAVLEHTMLPEDLPMLIEILKVAKICNVEPFGNSQYYYLGQVCTWASTTILLNPDNLPIIPLHDFVSPTKEEKQTLDTIDARLKRLEEIYNKQADPVIAAKEEQPKAEWKPKVGEWVYVESFDTYILVESIDDKRAHGYNQNQKDPYHVLINGLRPATEEEIGNYLIGLAKQRYKTGNIVECLSYIDNECIKKDIEYYWQANILWGKQLKANGQQEHIAVYEKGKWAEVLPPKLNDWNVSVQPFNEFRDDYKIVVYPNNGWLETKEQAEKYAETIKNALNG